MSLSKPGSHFLVTRTPSLHPWIWLVLALFFSTSTRGHDLTTSHVLVRFKAEEIELQIKIAADSAWPLVQELAPGAVFSAEEFETTGRPLLLKFTETLDALAIDGASLPALRRNISVVEDTFLFSTVYRRPAGGTLRIEEAYLKKMSPDYTSNVRVVDQRGQLIASKILSTADARFEISLPPVKTESPSSPKKP